MTASTRPAGSRAEQKDRTRRAILDAALTLCEESPLGALSLRQVAKQVGIVPTAFYRHFDSVEQLGLALVEESLASLRAMLREVRTTSDADYHDVIDRSVAVLLAHVRRQDRHYAFIVRERSAGPAAVRAAIAHGIELFERELATDIGHFPGARAWSDDDLRILSSLIVSAMVATVERIVATAPGSTAEDEVARSARTQLRMLLIGILRWRSEDGG